MWQQRRVLHAERLRHRQHRQWLAELLVAVVRADGLADGGVLTPPPPLPHEPVTRASARPAAAVGGVALSSGVSLSELAANRSFQLRAPFPPAGDQATAIAELTEALASGAPRTMLKGATGTGKTFVMAHVVPPGSSVSGTSSPKSSRRRNTTWCTPTPC